MQGVRTSYLIRLQFLGFRYSGWQRQPAERTVEGMVLKTLRFILPEQPMKVLGAGRTDAKVSALDYAFELFLEGTPITDLKEFLVALNQNLPPDMRAMEVSIVEKGFNIIQDSKTKEYVYLFSYGKKNHPFCAPFMANILGPLKIEEMKKAAALFQGTHDFSAYTARKREGAKCVRTIVRCEIRENDLLSANFFPSESFALHIVASGFLRYQVRMIMGALIQLGKGTISHETIQHSLKTNNDVQLTFVAPGSGLMLHQLDFASAV